MIQSSTSGSWQQGALLVWGEWKARLGQQSPKARKKGGKMNILNWKKKKLWAEHV